MEEVKQAEESGIQALVEEMLDSQKKILKELRKVIVGQDEVIEQVLISLYVGGGIASSRDFPGWPRRSWSTVWPRRWGWSSNASSSLQI